MSAQAFDDMKAVKLIVEKHIRPGYASLAADTEKMHEALNKFCAKPTAFGLDKVRQRFSQLALAWSRVEHIRFGPISYENRIERFLFWPDRKGRAEKQVSRALNKLDSSLLDAATLKKKSVALQSLGALEYLLYGKFAGKLLQKTPAAEFRCKYAMAIARNHKDIARETMNAWTKGKSFPQLFLDPGTHNAVYRFPDEVSAEIIGSFIVGAQLIVRKLTFVHRAYARKMKGTPFERSELTISVISRNVTSIYEIQNCCGIGDLFSKKFVEDYAAMQKNLAASAPRLDKKLQRTLSKKWETEPDTAVLDSLRQINKSLARAMELTAKGMARALNITKKFNSLDGD